MFKSIGALAVYVTDKERAKQFYTTVLGFELAADLGPTLCFLKSPNGAIDIYLEGGKQPAAADSESSRLSREKRLVDSFSLSTRYHSLAKGTRTRRRRSLRM